MADLIPPTRDPAARREAMRDWVDRYVFPLVANEKADRDAAAIALVGELRRLWPMLGVHPQHVVTHHRTLIGLVVDHVRPVRQWADRLRAGFSELEHTYQVGNSSVIALVTRNEHDLTLLEGAYLLDCGASQDDEAKNGWYDARRRHPNPGWDGVLPALTHLTANGRIVLGTP